MSVSRSRRERLLAAALVALAGLVVYWLAVDLFPYHSVNDDEGVYLAQAAMLLEGKLFLHPGALGELVRPWFFVADTAGGDPRYYSKYSPVAAGVFALGKLLGDANLVLGLVAAGNAALVYALTTAAFDRRTGGLSVVALVGAPLFLFTSAVFLPYAPTTLLNLAFAVAYVRTMRRNSPRWGLVAGAATGLAFFARPYTAVCFATPFIAHALGSLWWTRGSDRFRPTVVRLLAVAGVGAAGVGLTLAYNAVVTGDPLLFPYKAFGPNDGLGFGHHELLGYDRTYTPVLAAETTVRLLRTLTTEWTVAGPAGTLLALVGLATLPTDRDALTDPALSAPALRALVFGLVPVVVLGNAYFWGTLNGLENGLIGLLGPYYHFDLLLPLSAFAAAGTLALGRRLRDATRGLDDRQRRVVLALALLVGGSVAGVAGADAVGEPYGENRLRTENLAATYEPVTEQSLDHAVVFVPDPYGDWLHHPFQYLRNDPGFDGDVVYVLNEGDEERYRALDATGDRRAYRFTYRGEWAGAEQPVTPTLTPLSVERGERVAATTTLGVPARATRAQASVVTEAETVRYDVGRVDGPVTVNWTVGADGVAVTNHDDGGSARLSAGVSEVTLLVTFVDPQGTTVTYRQTASVERTGGTVRVIWPPETRVCALTTDCGREGLYVGPDGDYISGVSVETAATGTATEASAVS
ncbi:ArnT family glycosyltransferase [Haloplanus litoreus]|uniref:ArnT family glycosyltransferase n=1 Tax=Haloplanus litoreus TaxID=767515 RepID=A0ABD5ZXZ8_9EURY